SGSPGETRACGCMSRRRYAVRVTFVCSFCGEPLNLVEGCQVCGADQPRARRCDACGAPARVDFDACLLCHASLSQELTPDQVDEVLVHAEALFSQRHPRQALAWFDLALMQPSRSDEARARFARALAIRATQDFAEGNPRRALYGYESAVLHDPTS